MKLVVVSDIHADWSTLGVPRFDEIAAALKQSVDAAIQEKADAWICLGDICDPDSGPSVFRVIELVIHTTQTLSDNHIPSIWLAGNHDVLEDGSGDTTLSPLRGLRNVDLVTVIEEPTVWTQRCLHGQIEFIGLPFTASSHPYNPEEFANHVFSYPSNYPRIVLSHLSVPGIVPGEETKEMPRGRDVTYPFAATKGATMRLQGHYHRHQIFDPKDGGPPIIIPGSLARLTFGEESHNPSFLVLEV